MLHHLLALREALARGETPDALGICAYIAERSDLSVWKISNRLRPHWANWPELREDFPLDWPVAGTPYVTGRAEGEADPQRRWTNPRRLSLLNHLIQEFSNASDL